MNVKRGLFRTWVVISTLWVLANVLGIAFFLKDPFGDLMIKAVVTLSVPVGLYVAWLLIRWILRGLMEDSR